MTQRNAYIAYDEDEKNDVVLAIILLVVFVAGMILDVLVSPIRHLLRRL